MKTTPFIKYSSACITVSVILIVVSVISLFTKGLKYGIDFKGGNIVHITFNEPTDENKIRAVFDELSKKSPLYFKSQQLVIQAVTGEQSKDRDYIVQYPAPLRDNSEADEAHTRIRAELKRLGTIQKTANVGPTVGDEMKRQGIQAAIVAIIGILLYLGYRFEFYSAIGAVVAIVHDVIITLGFVSLIGIEFDITVLAAFLTLLGYSVNDTIVIFDRVRENRKILKENSFSRLFDISISQTIQRTLNTTFTTLLALIALLVLGGASIEGFTTTLTCGCIVGTYSSLFIASPVWLALAGDKAAKKRA